MNKFQKILLKLGHLIIHKIDDEKLSCPNCKQSNKITLSEHEGLSYFISEKEARESNFFLESEVYATAKCWNCGRNFNVHANFNLKIR